MRFLNIFSIAKHSLLEQYRGKSFTLFVMFAGVILYSSMLIGVMAVEEEKRVITDFGLALMELMAMAFIVFSAGSAVSREMESKTIYLILTRPVTRLEYLLGKILSLFFSSLFMLAVMSVLHLSLIYLRGFSVSGIYFAIVFCIWLKLIIITSITFFISSFSTSLISTMSISVILWMLGHFVSETKFLVERTKGGSFWFIKAVAYLIPNMQIYNMRDMAEAFGRTSISWIHLFGYAFAWTALSFIFTFILFRKKEF
ncbi:MAG: ABC transporter permease subunit [Elusimicrobia bacterium]|nr:ABC transporter permease subunit [Elusimicrobiota bacterium]